MVKTRMLNEGDAAALLGLSPRTLSQWRWTGIGPRFHKFGRAVRYKLSDLIEYVEKGAVT